MCGRSIHVRFFLPIIFVYVTLTRLFFRFFQIVAIVVYSHSVTQITNFDQFVKFYGKHYKEDEYAFVSSQMVICRSRRSNFVENAQRLKTTKKLIGTDLQYSFYSDFSELRFRKSLMVNNRYPKPDLSDFYDVSDTSEQVPESVNWRKLIPPLIDVDPSIKCASSWAVAVTTLLYMKYKEQDPLWDVVLLCLFKNSKRFPCSSCLIV